MRTRKVAQEQGEGGSDVEVVEHDVFKVQWLQRNGRLRIPPSSGLVGEEVSIDKKGRKLEMFVDDEETTGVSAKVAKDGTGSGRVVPPKQLRDDLGWDAGDPIVELKRKGSEKLEVFKLEEISDGDTVYRF